MMALFFKDDDKLKCECGNNIFNKYPQVHLRRGTAPGMTDEDIIRTVYECSKCHRIFKTVDTVSYSWTQHGEISIDERRKNKNF